ncbi:hypothetical protein ACHAXR_007682 [Thalassiosira sp. AJA248-18]
MSIPQRNIPRQTHLGRSRIKTEDCGTRRGTTKIVDPGSLARASAGNMDDSRSTLTLVSWNVSFAQSSFVAPDIALRTHEAPRLLRDECLQSHPDIIALQESPSESWGETVFPEYVSIGTQLASHVQEGHIDLLVRRELAPNARRISLEHPAFPLPSVAAAITLPNGTQIAVCSNHFPHKAEGATIRELMCEAIMVLISETASNCICIGDFNMREKEDKVAEALAGGGWVDAWKGGGGSSKKLKFTWNSRENTYHENGFPFVARFDRAYVRGNELTVRRFDLIGNQPVEGKKGDYLSDHFGIAVEVGVLGVHKANGTKDTNKSNTKEMDMVDLTGDSDDEDKKAEEGALKEGALATSANTKSESNRNDINTAIGNRSSDNSTVTKSVSAEEMRRLRLQKFSGLNDNKTAQASSSTTSSCSVSSLNEKVSSSLNDFPCKSENNQSTQIADTSGDIEPVKPTCISIADKSKRYIIYMAIRERKGSKFAEGLTICNDVCHDDVKNCLQMDGTRHATMFDGYLSSDIVQKLKFNGNFDPLEVKLDSWKPWDAGCYLKLADESKGNLQDLLAKIDGLPTFGGKRPCDHISLYRKRPQTNPNLNLKREFGNIREATKSHNWGSVQGVSIRIKALGGPYEECIVLADARSFSECSVMRSDNESNKAFIMNTSQFKSSKTNDANNTTRNSEPPLQCDTWNDGCDDSDEDRDKKSTKNKEDSKAINAATFRETSSTKLVLSIISWNISQIPLSDVSAAAPDPALRAQDSSRLICEECLRPHFASQQQDGNTHLPDIIALQECPDEQWGSMVFGQIGYISMGTQESHSGFVDLLIRKDFASQRIWMTKDGTWCGGRLERNEHSSYDDHYKEELPCVSAIITLPNSTQVAVASNHLEAGTRGASSRSHQCKLLMELLAKKTENVILIGDFNMRQKEDKKTENLVGGGWLDAWKEGSGASQEKKMTWNSIENLYHHNGFGFTCRFDRCYLRGRELGVKQFNLMGNQPVNGVKGDYLSDHYGLAVEVNIAPSSDIDHKKVNAAAKSEEDKSTDNSRRRKEDNYSNGDSERSNHNVKLNALNADNGEPNNRSNTLWGSKGDKMVLEETPLRANGKRARSASSDTTASKNATQLANDGSAPTRGSNKEQKKRSKAKATKKCRFDSSSSDDDGEELRRLWHEKHGKKYTKRRSHSSSSDSDDDDEKLRRLWRKKHGR